MGKPLADMTTMTLYEIQEIVTNSPINAKLILSTLFSNISSSLNSITSISTLVPSSQRFLLPLIAENFPFMNESVDVHTDYINSILVIGNSIPELLDSILILIFDRLIQIDLASQSSSNEMIHTLDALFPILIKPEYYSSFIQILPIILSTRNTMYVQFIYFELSKQQDYCDEILGHLVQAVMNPNTSKPIRVNSCCYISGLLSRCSKIDMSLIEECIILMLQMLNSCEDLEVYYNLVQAILYVFIFKWRELVNRDIIKVLTRDLQTAFIKNKPLKYVNLQVANEFARVTSVLEIMYVFPFIVGKEDRIRDWFPFDSCEEIDYWQVFGKGWQEYSAEI